MKALADFGSGPRAAFTRNASSTVRRGAITKSMPSLRGSARQVTEMIDKINKRLGAKIQSREYGDHSQDILRVVGKLGLPDFRAELRRPRMDRQGPTIS